MRAKKQLQFRWRRRVGFTLVELIVVIGLMAFLSTIAATGYFSVTRGMASRGAIQDTSSIIRYAMQTCLIDQVPTAVLFMNYRSDKGTNGDAYGRAIAIRMSGRISYVARGGSAAGSGGSVSTGMLVDEFADWNQSFTHEAASGAQALSIRIYRMQSENEIKSGIFKCSSLMYNWVGYADLDRFNSEYMIGAQRKVEDWCAEKGKSENTSYSSYRNGNAYRWGLPFHVKNDGLSVGEWHAGDAYGMAIAEFTLPKNYIFGKSNPKDTKLTPANPGALVFWPDKVTSSSAYEFSVQEVTISQLFDVEGKDIREVGKVNRDSLKDQD